MATTDRPPSVLVNRTDSVRLTCVIIDIPYDATAEQVDQAFADARKRVRVEEP
jgi:hypothetical protein